MRRMNERTNERINRLVIEKCVETRETTKVENERTRTNGK